MFLAQTILSGTASPIRSGSVPFLVWHRSSGPRPAPPATRPLQPACRTFCHGYRNGAVGDASAWRSANACRGS